MSVQVPNLNRNDTKLKTLSLPAVQKYTVKKGVDFYSSTNKSFSKGQILTEAQEKFINQFVKLKTMSVIQIRNLTKNLYFFTKGSSKMKVLPLPLPGEAT